MLKELTSSIFPLNASLFICVSFFHTLIGHNHGMWNSNTQIHENVSVLDQLLRTDNSVARQLRDTEHRLRMKEKEVKICQREHCNEIRARYYRQSHCFIYYYYYYLDFWLFCFHNMPD